MEQINYLVDIFFFEKKFKNFFFKKSPKIFPKKVQKYFETDKLFNSEIFSKKINNLV